MGKTRAKAKKPRKKKARKGARPKRRDL